MSLGEKGGPIFRGSVLSWLCALDFLISKILRVLCLNVVELLKLKDLIGDNHEAHKHDIQEKACC